MSIENVYDVIVIGSGAAGLLAGWELAAVGKKVLILEARDRIGGRILTVAAEGFSKPIERGAEFVHGKLPLTLSLLEKAGITYTEMKGDFWENYDGNFRKNNEQIDDYTFLKKEFKALEGDMSVAQFMEEKLSGPEHEDLRTTLQSYVEGYYAGTIEKASTAALCQELTESDDINFRVDGGYERLISYLATDFEAKGGRIKLSSPVTKVADSQPLVAISTETETYHARKAVITLPIGVLAANTVAFSPSIHAKIEAAKALGFGPVIKLNLSFTQAFWEEKQRTAGKDLSAMSFLFSDQKVPTWWTQYPEKSTQLTGWITGPAAERLKYLSEDDLREAAFESLSQLFKTPAKELSQLCTGSIVTAWIADPYTLCGYSYEVVNGAALKAVVSEPINNAIFFAGEGLYNGPEIGTVEAALQTGRNTAHQLIAAF